MKKKFRNFEDAKKFVQTIGLKGQKDWVEYCKSSNKPSDIPANLDKTYKNKGWTTMGDFLGTNTVATFNRKYKTFEDAREFVQTIGLKSGKEWGEYCKTGNKSDDIPSAPWRIYKNKGWTNWGDFLGTGNIFRQKKQYRSFQDAREFVQTLGLKGAKEWEEYCTSGNRPSDISASPNKIYKNIGWINWGDFVGTGRTRNFRSFENAREFIQSLGFKGQKDWLEYCKSDRKQNDIPSSPDKTYKNKGWTNWGDFLGTGIISPMQKNKEFRDFKDAREFIQSLGLKGRKEWNEYCTSGNKPSDIPAHPWIVYKEWKK